MSNVFGKMRNVELSIIYGLETLLDANWDNITVVKGYPSSALPNQLPVVAIRLLTDTSERKEIGSRTLKETYNIIIDIFAKSDGQRLDLAQFIKDQIINNFTYYTHNKDSGDLTTLVRTSAGQVVFLEIVENQRLDFGQDVELFDKYRHVLSFDCRVQLNGS